MKFISRKKRFLFLIIVFLIIIFSCIHIEPSHHGVIRDSETNERLKDVLVHLDLYYECYFPPPLAGTNPEFLGVQESFTDDTGEYHLPIKLYFLPPRLCFSGKYFKFFKPGYFPGSRDYPYLYKMTHYLNYLPYKKLVEKYHGASYPDISNLLPGSESYQKILEQIGAMELSPNEKKGVFLRLPGRKLTRMYAKKLIRGHIGGMAYHVFDEASGDWLTIDCRGKMLEDKTENLPKWDYMDINRSNGSWPIYANQNSIFYPEIPYNTGEVKFIVPHKGNISDLAGTAYEFFTIEDEGRLMCHYKRSPLVSEKFDPTKMEKKNSIPFYYRCINAKDLPKSEQDETLEDSLFKYVAAHSIFVTKTPKYWHIYRFYPVYDKKINRNLQKIMEIASLPANKEIVAFAVGNDGLYIAFKNEGIKKYSHPPFYFSSKIVFKEKELFFKNSQESMPPDVYSIVVGSAVNLQAIYVTAGDDKIFRFSLDGIPDYRVN